MPQTTTAKTARNCKLYLDDAAGTPVDISGSSNKVEWQFANTIAEGATFSSQWMFRLVDMKDAPVTVDIWYSTAEDEGWDVVKNWFFGGSDAPRTVRMDIPDSSTGSDRFEGEFLLENMTTPVDASGSDPIKVSLSLKPTGAISLDTITS